MDKRVANADAVIGRIQGWRDDLDGRLRRLRRSGKSDRRAGPQRHEEFYGRFE